MGGKKRGGDNQLEDERSQGRGANLKEKKKRAWKCAKRSRAPVTGVHITTPKKERLGEPLHKGMEIMHWRATEHAPGPLGKKKHFTGCSLLGCYSLTWELIRWLVSGDGQ